MFEKKLKIAVIGAGIIGCTSASVLIESVPNVDITIISEKFTPNTTSDGSGGLIYPYLSGSTDRQRIRKWINNSLVYLNKYYQLPDSGKFGIGLLSMYYLLEDEEVFDYQDFDDIMISQRPMTSSELKQFSSSSESQNKWTKGVYVTTYYAECRKLLPYLLQQFKSKGGKVCQQRVDSLQQLIGKYDIVINCRGLEAGKCSADQSVHPIRGQVYRISAPWIKHSVMAGNHYIVPNSDCVVLGGTKQLNNWDTNVDPIDSKDIMDGCSQLIPSIRTAQVVNEWVGLRPGRHEVRLEREVISDGQSNQLQVIHNYGHGGCGVTLSFGCAHEVLDYVQQIISSNNVKSRL
ncbi:D-amino-acid oxidase-like [Oppia nitens]|uniref:D-amino-acid oxidase-like n=1 Tax=Oppia nitens TaxID=1686743 RepID=UPI0023D9F0FE|nr:D-amino-acid oxidase-like [Oppia nitens]